MHDPMLDYKPFVDGKTIQQWFGDLEYNVSSRIFQSVQKGIIEGMTLNSIMQVIQGSAAEGFKDGIPEFKPGVLKTNRQSAEILARTTINAVANQSRLEIYRTNADVIDEVQWLASLDHRTCLICGVYDGKIWTNGWGSGGMNFTRAARCPLIRWFLPIPDSSERLTN